MKMKHHYTSHVTTTDRGARPTRSPGPGRPAGAAEGLFGETVSADGRIARGERTRRRLAEGLIALLEAGNLQPTAKDVATEAGVSLRLVFHHFKDMEAIYEAGTRLQAERHWRTLHPAQASLPRAERVRHEVRQRTRLFEAISPVRRGGVAMAAQSSGLSERINQSNLTLRDLLARSLAPELAAADPRQKELLDALDAVTSWEMWERLRRAEHLGVAAAQRTVVRMVTALLESADGEKRGVSAP
jgi:AcrR family transcriptional regulator